MERNVKILTFDVFSERNRTDTPLELVVCGTDNFNYTKKAEILLKAVDTLYCVKNK
jgi:hypothetical protein